MPGKCLQRSRETFMQPRFTSQIGPETLCHIFLVRDSDPGAYPMAEATLFERPGIH